MFITRFYAEKNRFATVCPHQPGQTIINLVDPHQTVERQADFGTIAREKIIEPLLIQGKGVIGKVDATDRLGFPDLLDFVDYCRRRAVSYIPPLAAVQFGHLMIETECAVIGTASAGNNNLYRVMV